MTYPQHSSYSHTFTWDYGSNGNLGSHTDSVNQMEWLYRYDEDGSIVTVNADRTGGEHYANSLIYRYTYDSSNQLTGASYLINGVRRAAGYEYDTNSRPTVTTFPNNANASISYDSESRVSSETITRSDYSCSTQYTYAAGLEGKSTERVSSISYSRGDVQKGSLGYSYDANGNITEITDSADGKDINYHYDAQGQLIREDNMKLGQSGQTIVYAYDAGGNLLTKKTYDYTNPDTAVTGTPTDTVSYSYTDSVWKDKLTSYDGKAITYDEIGNPLTYA